MNSNNLEDPHSVEDPHAVEDKGRRNFLITSAGLGIASSMGAISPAHAMNWHFEQFQPRPENTNWRIIDAHDTGHVTSKSTWKRKNCGHNGRVSFDPPADGKKSFAHVVKKGGIVHPLAVDSANIPADFSSFDRVLMRYHHWIEDYSSIDGKWIGLQLGRGWVGRQYAKGDNELYGSDGCSATTMHPARGKGNGLRLLVTYKGQKSPYGNTIGKARDLVPKNTWVTTDVVVQKKGGYRLYMDGVKIAEDKKMIPVANWESCRCIWYRTRLMHGGTPEKLKSVRNYKEWFGGFFIGVA